MTAAEAIKIQEKRLASPFVKAHTDTAEATRLGVEALKREQTRREYETTKNPFYPFKPDLLPGETEK